MNNVETRTVQERALQRRPELIEELNRLGISPSTFDLVFIHSYGSGGGAELEAETGMTGKIRGHNLNIAAFSDGRFEGTVDGLPLTKEQSEKLLKRFEKAAKLNSLPERTPEEIERDEIVSKLLEE